MKKSKLQSVTLFNETLNVTEEYEINHAERILRMPNNGGWTLPKDSEYKFDFDNGIGIKQNKKRDNGTEKTGDDKQGG